MGVVGGLDDGIRAQETADLGIVKAPVHVYKPYLIKHFMPGVASGRLGAGEGVVWVWAGGSFGFTGSSPGVVGLAFGDGESFCGGGGSGEDGGGGAEVVFEEVFGFGGARWGATIRVGSGCGVFFDGDVADGVPMCGCGFSFFDSGDFFVAPKVVRGGGFQGVGTSGFGEGLGEALVRGSVGEFCGAGGGRGEVAVRSVFESVVVVVVDDLAWFAEAGPVVVATVFSALGFFRNCSVFVVVVVAVGGVSAF